MRFLWFRVVRSFVQIGSRIGSHPRRRRTITTRNAQVGVAVPANERDSPALRVVGDPGVEQSPGLVRPADLERRVPNRP